VKERNTEQRGRQASLGYGMDIIERKRTQHREKQLNLLLRTIIDIHRLIDKERDVDRLIKGVCQCFARIRGYRNTWIVLLDESNKPKNIATYRMHKNLRLMIERLERGELPKCAEVALTQAKAVVSADPLSVCAGCALYDDECAMTVRLEHAGKVYALLTVAATKDLITHPDEQTLVKELGGDIAFALFRIELEERFKRSEENCRSLINNIPDVTWTSDENYNIVFVSPNVKEVSGYSQEEEYQIGSWTAWFDRVHPDDMERGKAAFRDLFKGRKHYDIEYRLKRKDGRWIWIQERSLGTYKRDGKLYADGVLTDITERKQMEEALQFYITEIIRAQEEERKRIAREIHDETAQGLAMVCADCDEILLTRKGLSDEATERLNQLRGRLKNILAEVRQLSHELRPGLLDQFGLIPSLELLIKEANARDGIDCRMEMITSERRIAPEAEVTLFRIVQEALRNTRKHSKATKAVVSVEFEKQQVEVSIRDNGSGFELPTALSSFTRRGKLGLMGMQERARLLNGNLRIKSQVGKGTTITVIIPT